LHGDEKLTNKDILLVGGGHSPILDELHHLHIRPKSVVNVDPYADPTKNPKQKLINQDFLKWKLKPNKWDEIWALYSLPAYSKDYKQIRDFYIRGLYVLAPNGNFRVFPIDHSFLSLLPNGVDLDPIKMQEVLMKFRDDLLHNVRNIKVKPFYHVRTGVQFVAPENKAELNEYLESL
jgi:hypothetical protein